MAKRHLKNDPYIMQLLTKRGGLIRGIHASGKITYKAGNSFKAKMVKPGLTPEQIRKLWRQKYGFEYTIIKADGVHPDLPIIEPPPEQPSSILARMAAQCPEMAEQCGYTPEVQS